MTPAEKIQRIERACFHGGSTHSWEDYREGLIGGAFRLFENDHGVCIAEIVQAPQKRFLQCWIVAGELPGVMDLQGEVDRYARDNGCAFMSTVTRRGWAKVLPNYGWKNTGLVFKREAGHE
jgi:hypothetical protein